MHRSGPVSRWLPVGAWALVIWSLSTDSFSGNDTSRLLMPVLDIFMPWADEGQIEAAHAVVRKAAHVTEYAILAVLTFRALSSPLRSPVQIAIWTVALCAMYAATDEFHQTFVASRTGAVSDVFLDTAGASLGAALGSLLARPFGWPLSSDRRSRA